MITWVSIVIFG